ncbi:hypothetical protein EL26_13640 [Tumebacillus flagellatus]|uniref:AB hydrolase-1 domain-containing protein n=2 Tax=Tumebacillus flagellatus TaxID=1157490 RepID=A0A074LKX5_9BACL|nr:hypothetical protein EL26_13640 [Tumebacillus flagellatus]
MAHEYSQQAEFLRQKLKSIKNQTQQVQSGVDRWTGPASFAYVLQRETLENHLDRMVLACEQFATTLRQVAERLYGLQSLRDTLKNLERAADRERNFDHGFNQPDDQKDYSRYFQLMAECEHYRTLIAQYEHQYETEAETAFSTIKLMIPKVHGLTQYVQSVGTYLFDSNHKPVLARLDFASGRVGRDRVEYLNEAIRMNQVAVKYYKAHPEQTGPNGESAEQMIQQAKALIKEARKQGGTYGVPILFMHGLSGGIGTFSKMVDEMGGFSTIYSVSKSGEMLEPVQGENDSPEHPCIQFVFQDGAMTFDKQTEFYKQMMEQLKKDYDTDTVMVISHSMGGVVTTKYIEETGGDDISRFVTLGSPIRGSDLDDAAQDALQNTPIVNIFIQLGDVFYPAVENLSSDSKETKQIYTDRGNFNSDIEVLSGYGLAKGRYGDGVVLPESATALKDFAGEGMFHSIVYPEADHSGLHESDQAIADVLKFILFGEIASHEPKP